MSWYSWSPLARAFAGQFGIRIEEIDVSLGALVLSLASPAMDTGGSVTHPQSRLAAAMAEPNTIIIKPPCVSATLSQARAAAAELLRGGCFLDSKAKIGSALGDSNEFVSVLGSVINRQLRQGAMVRELRDHTQAHVESGTLGGSPSIDPETAVVSMYEGGFRETEQSLLVSRKQVAKIEFVVVDGDKCILAEGVELQDGDVCSFSVLRKESLRAFLQRELNDAEQRGLAVSLQLKRTVLKTDEFISFEADEIDSERVRDQPAGDLDDNHSREGQTRLSSAVEQDTDARIHPARSTDSPEMHPSEKGAPAPNFGVTQPSIARAMADAILRGGRVPLQDGSEGAAKFVVPDRSYGEFYRAVLDDFKRFGPLQPDQLANVTIVGLTKDAAEEYGANSTTFRIPTDGYVQVVANQDANFCIQGAFNGDIWRMMKVSASAIEVWCEAALQKAVEIEAPALFLLDHDRPFHQRIRHQIVEHMARLGRAPKDARFMSIADGTKYAFRRLRSGHGVVLAVGNLMRDFLSELIFALAGEGKRIVRSFTVLPAGGRVFEIGTAGTAPKIFRQFLATNVLRWDPVCEAIAFAQAFRSCARHPRYDQISFLADGLENAIEWVRHKRPKDCVDTREVHFLLAKQWAKWMTRHRRLYPVFEVIHLRLSESEAEILADIRRSFGCPVDLGGYYYPNERLVEKCLQPSRRLNEILEECVPLRELT
jgi:isocitrate dehydrogenase